MQFSQLNAFAKRCYAKCLSLGVTAKYLIFFGCLLGCVTTGTFWGEPKPLRGIGWEDINALVTLFCGVWVASRNRSVRFLSFLLAITALVTAWWALRVETRGWLIVGEIATCAFLGFTALVVLVDISRTRGVTGDTIIGAVCVYLLIGATWGFLYSLVELLVPGSLRICSPDPGEVSQRLLEQRDFPLLMYYSFITLTSTGYGDIAPVKQAARMLSCMEALTGQVYLIVLVVRLVSLHVARMANEQHATPPPQVGPAGERPTE